MKNEDKAVWVGVITIVIVGLISISISKFLGFQR
jgi:hypothetical protein